MVGGGFLGEAIRYIVIRVWQSKCPVAAWRPKWLPTAAAYLAATDSSPRLIHTQRLLRVMWNWDTSLEDRRIFTNICAKIFKRSAALAAAAICAVTRRTGRLSREAGGVTVALEDIPHVRDPWYQARLRYYCDVLIGPERAEFIHFVFCADGPQKGAAILVRLKVND